MKQVDSSVIVAAFASWHEFHHQARRALDAGAGASSHAALEAYSVLTRLPPPHRAPADVVSDFLKMRFRGPYAQLDSAAHSLFLTDLPALGISGGAAYDGLIARVAAESGAVLVTCDRRGQATYGKCDVEVEFIGG